MVYSLEGKEMKVLVITYPAWNTSNNTGNTMSNIFSHFDGEFANIYFSEEKPKNDICSRYFQVCDRNLLNHLFKGEPLGKIIQMNEDSDTVQTFETSAKKYKNFYTLLARQILWSFVRIDNKEMYDFISDFKPDIIYAPTYGNPFVLRTVRNLKENLHIPLVSYISDDLYSYKSSMNTPLKKLYQWILRKDLLKNFKLYDVFYTMTKKQKEEYEPLYGKEMKLLYKTSDKEYKKHIPNTIKKIIYAGGIYLGRDQVLEELVKVIKELNQDHKQFELHIYTSGYNERLNDKENSFLHGMVTYEELQKKYEECDIALHVESFEQKNREDTRLSFSTKIVDCLESGLPVLAICPKENAGFEYLKEEDAAVCVSNIEDIRNGLETISSQYEIYQDKAYQCLMKNHNPKKMKEMLENDFKLLVEGKGETTI